jgi:hypothetical protein
MPFSFEKCKPIREILVRGKNAVGLVLRIIPRFQVR